MADTVTLDPGAGGAVVATDDAGAGGHVQIVKLAISTDGSATVIPADATNGLLSDVKRIQDALPAGTNAIGKLAANSGVDIGDVDVTSIAAGTNAIGNVGVVPRTSGGLSIATDIDLDETELEVKASAGQLFGWYIYNDGAAKVYVKLYNDTAANVVVGTTVPVMTFGVPAGSAANILSPMGIAFSAGICAAATTVPTTADTTAPAANQVVANFFYA